MISSLPMTERSIFKSEEELLIAMIVDYLCEDHTETELMDVVDKAIRYANGE